MKKIIVILAAATILGCTHNTQAPSDNSEDSTLYLIDGKHTVIYNTITHKYETVKIAPMIEDGDIKITEQGDTLYWLEGDTLGRGKYVSKEEYQLNSY